MTRKIVELISDYVVISELSPPETGQVLPREGSAIGVNQKGTRTTTSTISANGAAVASDQNVTADVMNFRLEES